MSEIQAMQAASATAEVVDTLTALRIPVPDDLLAARTAYDIAMSYGGPPLVDPDEAFNVAPDEVTALLDRAADARAHRTAITAIRADIVRAFANRGRHVLARECDNILGAVSETFRKAAMHFEQAYRHLPAGWAESGGIDRFGADAYRFFSAAKTEAETLELCAIIRSNLPADVVGQIAVGCRYAKCRDTDAAIRASQARKSTLGIWGSLLAVDGVLGLRWHSSVAEHKAYAASLAAAPTAVRQLTPDDQLSNRRVDAELNALASLKTR